MKRTKSKSEDLPRFYYIICGFTAPSRITTAFWSFAMRLFFVLVALSLATNLGIAQQILPTGPQPVNVFQIGNDIHVITSQIDKNFDGISDQSDGPGTWSTFDKTALTLKLETEFPWGFVVGGRVGVNAVSGRLYINVGDSVLIFSLEDHTQQGVLSPSMAFAVSSSSDGKRIYLSRRPTYNEPGYVDQITVGSPSPIRLDAGINPQMTKTYRTSDNSVGVAIVCEGVYGESNGTLDIWAAGQTGYERTPINVGDTPNYVVVDEDFAYVIVNASHTIVKINLLTKSAVDTFSTETSGLEGPREAVINGGYIFVSTFAGDVRVFDKNTGMKLYTHDVDFNAEAVAFIDDKLFVTRTFQTGSYNSDSGVAIYTLDQILSVAETAKRTGSIRALFAIGESIELPMFAGSADLELYDVRGNRGSVSITDQSSMRVDVSRLTPGIYIITDGKQSVVVGK